MINKCKRKIYRISCIAGLGFLFVGNIDAQTMVDNILNKAHQGEIVSLPGILDRKPNNLSYEKKVLDGTQLLMSDDPEYVSDTSAIVLRERVMPGKVRLYMYNVNGVTVPIKMPRKIIALVQNTGTKNMHFLLLKKSTQKPSSSYYQVGKKGLADYFSSKPAQQPMVLKPGEAVPVDSSLETQVADYNELVHGLYEFSIDGPGEVTVLQTAPAIKGTDALKMIHHIVPTGNLNAGRGLFKTADYAITTNGLLDSQNGPVVLTLADGKTDAWVKGIEGTSLKKVELAGNYGVMYHITLHWKSTDGRALALVTWNPMSGVGQWCDGMANTMIVSGGKFDSGIVQLPDKVLSVGGKPDAILVQVFKPVGDGSEQTISLIYSPPGASCLPTPLVFIPVENKQ